MFKKPGRAHRGTLDARLVTGWMVADLARRLQRPASEIDTTKPFDALGLDSRNAVQIRARSKGGAASGSRLQSCSTTSTIDELATYLARELSLPR